MKLRALFELMRVSNLPTVWSNAILGVYAGAHLSGYLDIRDGKGISFGHFNTLFVVVSAAFGFSLLYVAGMMLNDVFDRSVDAKERPHRPIPSGRVSAKAAMCFTCVCFAIGVLTIGLVDWELPFTDHQPWLAVSLALALVLVIIAYDLWHQRSAMSVLLMGLCRGLIVVSAASIYLLPTTLLTWWLYVVGPAATLMVYTVLISVVARREVDPERGGFGGPKAIMNMIAAMPLLDAVWLLAMGLWPASLVCVACAGLTKLGHRRIAGS